MLSVFIGLGVGSNSGQTILHETISQSQPFREKEVHALILSSLSWDCKCTMKFVFFLLKNFQQSWQHLLQILGFIIKLTEFFLGKMDPEAEIWGVVKGQNLKYLPDLGD